MNRLPRVAVLMATYNGIKYLPEQLASLLQQSNVLVEIYVSDDFSTDGTWEYIKGISDTRVHALMRTKKFKSAAKNFFHLFEVVSLDGFDYVALTDQDDIWNLNKLEIQISTLNQSGYDVCSSDVTAFWVDSQNMMKSKYIRKSQPIGKWNHHFESAGPGCTFVFKVSVIVDFKSYLSNRWHVLVDVDLHDWLLFSFVRSRNYKWYILPESTLLYRQHSNNVIGVNSGWRSYVKRLSMMKGGWFLQQILIIAEIFELTAKSPIINISRLNLADLFFLIKNVPSMRRKRLDQIIFTGYLIYLYFSRLEFSCFPACKGRIR